jgi:hypothetical protein
LSKRSLLAYCYFSFSDSEKQKPRNFLRSVIAQLLSTRSQIPDKVQELYDRYRTSDPPLDELKDALKSALNPSVETFIFIDALDECPAINKARKQLCELLVEISKWSIPDLHILVTSRKVAHIKEALFEIESLIEVPIRNAKVDSDIRVYVKSRIANDPKLARLATKVEEIETVLVKKANGMHVFVCFPEISGAEKCFRLRWAFCQIEALRKCRTRNDVLRSLQSLPETLDETYKRILEGIEERDHMLAATALRWLLVS